MCRRTNDWGSGTSRDLKKIAFTNVNTVTFAPIPIANTSAAKIVKRGVFDSIRAPIHTSRQRCSIPVSIFIGRQNNRIRVAVQPVIYCRGATGRIPSAERDYPALIEIQHEGYEPSDPPCGRGHRTGVVECPINPSSQLPTTWNSCAKRRSLF